MKRPVLIGALGALGVLTFSACTPEEVAMWQEWHAEDPAAAEAFADDYVAQQRADDRSEDQSETASSGDDSVDGGVWDRVAECESNGNWSINTGNGYYGGLQFALSSWRAVGGNGYPHEASKAEQIRRAELLLDAQGWDAWPTCARRLGLL